MNLTNDQLRSDLLALGLNRPVVSARPLSGGYIAHAWMVTFDDGSRVAVKTLPGAPAGMFQAEADGLAALAVPGHLAIPEVRGVSDRMLVLEMLAPRVDTERSWEALARDLAATHRGTVHDRFGWHSDGWLGRIEQRNAWADNGHEFFAQNRVLRYLEEPAVQRELTADDWRAVELFCDRLEEIVPVMPPVLTHGDLWPGNLLSTEGGRMAVIDPAVSCTWAEVDLSMLWCCRRPAVARRFFDVYQELNPSPPGWEERMPLLHVRELLSSIAHIGDDEGEGRRLRSALAPFYRR